MPTNEQLTLFLWLQGLFPRRVNYWLLIKGLVLSPQDLLNGETMDPNLSLVRLNLDVATGSISWKSNPESDPLPPEISTSSPCLRIRDTKTGNERWVRESSSIITYLEEVYADRGPSLKPRDLLDVAAMNDLVGQINLSIIESLTYIRHASPQFAAFAGIKEEERSQPAARVGHQGMVKGFMKVQDWARDSLATTGWLTPGTDGPGLVDANLAAVRRYLELVYGWDIFEKSELKPLAEWYERFKGLPWWAALEERPNVHPSEFKFTIEKFEV
ncbi:hypothetical protein GQX73_g7349 [Xylaria multiplex]|uniref:GST N-terminal domain-containing protein n=1 Tax=Xylaria multiplex TaxID=323545 RepID=A0A7C8MLZ7_9PEZI|nr:hypothetical protein GQX73_g7349 [Xylaria multiplex]